VNGAPERRNAFWNLGMDWAENHDASELRIPSMIGIFKET